MNRCACGDDFSPLNRALAAPEITDETARFAHQQNARRDIPDAETALPKSVKAASGNPGEVERGRTKAADARNLGRNGVKDLFELPEIAMTQERNAGRKQRLRHIATRGDAEATILEPGALALFRPEAFVGQRLIDEAGHNLAIVLDRDRDGEMRDAVKEIGGAVQWIDDPAETRVLALLLADFLHNIEIGRAHV